MTDNTNEPTHRPTPIERQIDTIARNVKARSPDGEHSLTVATFVSALGQKSHATIILVLTVMNMIPGPPGYGGTVAATIIFVTVAMLMGKPLTIGGWLGRRKIPEKLIERMLDRLRLLARLMARVSRPRLLFLTGPRARMPMGVFIIAVSLPMMLPIPLINAVPNVGIAIICLSRINRDGIGLLLGIVVSLVGLGVAAGAIWGAISLARVVLGS